MDWNDLRYFLAVAEQGSTLSAGRALNVSQPTVARRLMALEQALGLSLFERRQGGYRLTDAGQALIEPARTASVSIAAVADQAGAIVRSLAGTVRLTAPRILAETVLQPVLLRLHQSHPGILIEVDTSEVIGDLAAGFADIALRRCKRPEGAGLVGRKIAPFTWAIYCSRDYAARHGVPKQRSELLDHEFIGGGEPAVWRMYGQWLELRGLTGQVSVHQGTTTGLLAAARAGAGLAALPALVAEHDPDLVRCLPQGVSFGYDLWLLTHERLRREARVRAVLDMLAAELKKLSATMPRLLVLERSSSPPALDDVTAAEPVTIIASAATGT